MDKLAQPLNARSYAERHDRWSQEAKGINSMNPKNTQRIEKEIATAFIRSAIAAGYTFEIDNGGDEDEIIKTAGEEKTLEAMFATDEDRVYVVNDGKAIGWVWFVYGNGADVITDYTVKLEELLTNAHAVAEQYQ